MARGASDKIGHVDSHVCMFSRKESNCVVRILIQEMDSLSISKRKSFGEYKIFLRAHIVTVSKLDKFIVDFTPLITKNLLVQSIEVADLYIFQPYLKVDVYDGVTLCILLFF